MTDEYRQWLREQAAAIASDGCSKVSEWNRDCCLEHDLAYYYGRSPAAAFHVGWADAPRVKRAKPDKDFLDCNQDNSPLKEGSIRAAVRWVGVRLGGCIAWRRHRKARP